MAKRNPLLSKLVLLPISWIYGMVTAVRNKMFDRGMLKQHTFKVPVIVVGNIAVGGTGKTPHVEYVVDHLRTQFSIGVLSRGYKRKTKGYVLASPRSAPEDIGDESWQIYHKFGKKDVSVAVCEKRVDGIDRMLADVPGINLMVLDDAFQHRYVKPKVAIVLTEYNRPAFNDRMMPYGHLRESVRAMNRADIVVVTKCPPSLKPMDYRIFKERLNLFPYQRLYFSRYAYGALKPVFPETTDFMPFLDTLTVDDSVLVVSGIANPRPFIRYMRRHKAKVRMLCFPDHHQFTHSDIDAINHKFTHMSGQRKYILTTEKDAVRLSHNPYYPRRLKPLTFYVPVSVEFIPQQGEQLGFVTALKRMIKERVY